MSAFFSLIWMQWRKTRWLLLALVFGSAAASGIVLVAARLGLHADMVLALGYISAFLPIVIAMGAVLLIHSDADRVLFYLPHRILRLPVASWRLTLALMLFGLVAVGAVALATTGILILAFDAAILWWAPAAMAVLLLAALQIWQFALRDPSPAGAVVTLLLILAPLGLVARVAFSSEFAARGGAVLASLVPWGVLYGAGVLALMLNRRGGIAVLSAADQRRSKRTVRLSEMSRFTSPLAAQRWYERKRFGWQLPTLLVAVLLVYFFLMPVLTTLFTGDEDVPTNTPERPAATVAIDWLGSPQFITTGFQIAALLAGVVVGAYIFTRAGYWNATTTYSLTLPVTTRSLALARIRVLFFSTVAGLAILGLLLALISAIISAQDENFSIADYLKQGYEQSLPGWFVMVFFVAGLGLFMWVAAWPVNAGFAMLAYGAVFAVVFGGAYLGRYAGFVEWSHNARESWTQLSTLTATVLVAIAFAGVAFAAVRKGLVSPVAAVVAVLLWCVYSGAFLVWGLAWEPGPKRAAISAPGRLQQMEGSTWPHPVDWSLWIGLSLLPIAPVILHPFLLDRARHR